MPFVVFKKESDLLIYKNTNYCMLPISPYNCSCYNKWGWGSDSAIYPHIVHIHIWVPNLLYIVVVSFIC